MKTKTKLPVFPGPDAFEQRYVRARAGRTLIVGSHQYPNRADRRLRYADVVGVDMLDGPGVDRVLNLEEPLPPDIGVFAHVECISVLEHSPRPWLLAANIERLMVPDATLHLSVPFIWRVHAYPSDFFRFTVEGVRVLFPGIAWSALMFANDRLDADCSGGGARGSGGDHPAFLRTEVYGFGVRR